MDVYTSFKNISIRVRIQKNLDDLTERCDESDNYDNESDKHLEARDPRYSCLISEAADTRVN